MNTAVPRGVADPTVVVRYLLLPKMLAVRERNEVAKVPLDGEQRDASLRAPAREERELLSVERDRSASCHPLDCVPSPEGRREAEAAFVAVFWLAVEDEALSGHPGALVL